MKVEITEATIEDHSSIWQIAQPIIQKGDTYAFDPKITCQKFLKYWCGKDKHGFVAKSHEQVVGTFIIKNNQLKLGAHVANASYMVHPKYNGQGIGRLMGEKSLEIASNLGYKALQFNLVVKTNIAAIALWKKLGFEIIGEVPKAFDHQQLGLVNAYVMYKAL